MTSGHLTSDVMHVLLSRCLLVCMVSNMICYMKPLPNLSVTFGLHRLVHLEENRFWVRVSPSPFHMKWLNPHNSSDVEPLWFCVAKSCLWLYKGQKTWPTTQPTQCAVIHSVDCHNCALSCVMTASCGTLLHHEHSVRGELFHGRAAKRNACSKHCRKCKLLFGLLLLGAHFFCRLWKGWVE